MPHPGRLTLWPLFVLTMLCVTPVAAGQTPQVEAPPAAADPAPASNALPPAAGETPAPEPTRILQPVSPQIPMSPAGARRRRPSGRVSLFANTSRVAVSGLPAVGAGEFITNLTYRSPEETANGWEYGLDLRQSTFTADGRHDRLSIFEGFVGFGFREGTLRARAGHLWLNDLGGLGAVAGAQFEYRQRQTASTPWGRLRAGAFGGLEPRLYEAGYADHVRKYGAYVALDGSAARKHIAGLIRVTNGSLTERSVASFTNFIPVGRRFFLYQAAEYDLQKPAGQAHGGWNYVFANARYSPLRRLDLQMTASRGRSLDTRGLSEDILAGRPVAPSALDGLLYQSIGGRATVEIFRGARAHAGYSRDRNNQADAATGRWLFGAYLADLGKSGFDITLSDSLIDRPTGSYHSRYASVGRQVWSPVYLTVDYSTSLSIVRFLRSDGFVIETRPETRRFGASAVVTIGRALSLLVNADYTQDQDVRDTRILSGVTYRLFR